jgi:SNF2 family DNA or RNA helicase
MLGSSATFRRLAAGRNETPSGELRELLTRALRPFLLRRTKEQVLRDLPTKTEQVIFCDLVGEQRREYDELRDHYRRALLASTEERGRVDPIQVLEALLRLRQMACHPGLIDPARSEEECAKFELLLPLIDEVREGGHKALVFSQFSSLLDLVRTRLDQRGVTYAQLDGRTTRRAEQVERFQTDPACDVFLITLKAGGYGLNLTAADYVFVLDPWWNPAAEAQAVDRAHRIGQTRPVMAYRLIARDTVEERVLTLQAHKRELAESVLGAGTAPLADMTREDLALLLA